MDQIYFHIKHEMNSLFTLDKSAKILEKLRKMSGRLGRVIITTKKAPAAIGPYNQAVQVSAFNQRILILYYE